MILPTVFGKVEDGKVVSEADAPILSELKNMDARTFEKSVSTVAALQFKSNKQ